MMAFRRYRSIDIELAKSKEEEQVNVIVTISIFWDNTDNAFFRQILPKNLMHFQSTGKY